MLERININNYGLIDQLELEFESGLNILTGETGAGKSIIIGALRYVLGERLNSSNIRDKEKFCTVEAVYNLKDDPLRNTSLFSDFFDNGDTELIISRSSNSDGRNKIKANGQSLTVTQLKAIGDKLTDFHGPHDHQMLLNEDNHIHFIDRLACFDKALNSYQVKFAKFNELRSKLRKLEQSAQNRERDIDTFTHQISELEEVPLSIDSHNDYMAEQKRINNTEALFKHASTLNQVLDNDEHSMSFLLREAFNSLSSINKIDDSTNNMTSMLDSMQETNDELSNAISNYCDSLSFDEERAIEVNTICDKYNLLKRKYGSTIEEVIDFYKDIKDQLETLLEFDNNDNKLKIEIDELESSCQALAAKLSSSRKASSKVLKSTIEKELKELGIKNIIFECRISPTELNELGSDCVRFYISPNAGEDLKPLADIVSSGEAARVMLALKKAMINVDPVPVLIFDEIDAQIGGRLGSIIGTKLNEIAQLRQVLLITHLPQIAAFAKKHFKVDKKIIDKKTLTTVCNLNNDQRVQELAHMMSGNDKSEISIQHAKDLLRKSS